MTHVPLTTEMPLVFRLAAGAVPVALVPMKFPFTTPITPSCRPEWLPKIRLQLPAHDEGAPVFVPPIVTLLPNAWMPMSVFGPITLPVTAVLLDRIWIPVANPDTYIPFTTDPAAVS